MNKNVRISTCFFLFLHYVFVIYGVSETALTQHEIDAFFDQHIRGTAADSINSLDTVPSTVIKRYFEHQNQQGKTWLHTWFEHNQRPLSYELLKWLRFIKKVNFFIKDNEGKTAFDKARESEELKDDYNQELALMSFILNPQASQINYAAYENNIDLVRRLWGKNTEGEFLKDEYGQTIVDYALLGVYHRLKDKKPTNTLAVLDFLIDQGIQYDSIDFLWYAIEYDDKALVEKILIKHPDLIYQNSVNDAQPLHYAQSAEMAELLLKYGSKNIEEKNGDYENTPLAQVLFNVKNDHKKVIEVARIFRKYGARFDVDMGDYIVNNQKQKRTPLYILFPEIFTDALSCDCAVLSQIL